MGRIVALLLLVFFVAAEGTPVVWHETYSLGTNYTGFFCVQETSGGDFIVCVRISYLDSQSNAALIRVDESGQIVWTTEYGGYANHEAI